MKVNPKFVIDTNVILVSISSHSKYHWIFELIIHNKIDILITNEIFTEYIEIISKKWNEETAKSVSRTFLELNNVRQLSVYYNFNLIETDPDDNKFVDCAIAGNADYIITQDRDFDVLKNIKFPKVNILNVEEFKKLVEKINL